MAGESGPDERGERGEVVGSKPSWWTWDEKACGLEVKSTGNELCGVFSFYIGVEELGMTGP